MYRHEAVQVGQAAFTAADHARRVHGTGEEIRNAWLKAARAARLAAEAWEQIHQVEKEKERMEAEEADLLPY